MSEANTSSRVRLDIGGNKFCTTVDTLTQREPDSMLAAMFSGRYTVDQDIENNYVFIDRDGTHFRHILNWLRDGVVPSLEDSSMYSELLREAEYYQLRGLLDEIHALVNKWLEDDRNTAAPSAELTRTDIIKMTCMQSNEKLQFRGVNLSGLDLSKLDLRKVNFSYACLKNARFSNCDLQDAKFNYADAEGAVFEKASLERCEFYSANLRGASFADARLQNAKIHDADFTNANLDGADVILAEVRNVKTTDANLLHAQLCSELLSW